ncbi:hypothetical protein [Rothia sp. ZJ932]|uniref:hypothetical protein n=1 Tax=Rothia sp. ZJ932 TaxID=2810516 RepID=UPI0019686816|nr:hypothetical protein [Rothia sp. ZJ932]QRZ61822.1 hypothetical protein JR346_01375 [Rothia sp. ZJ932]
MSNTKYTLTLTRHPKHYYSRLDSTAPDLFTARITDPVTGKYLADIAFLSDDNYRYILEITLEKNGYALCPDQPDKQKNIFTVTRI